jgi:hypothetical protein
VTHRRARYALAAAALVAAITVAPAAAAVPSLQARATSRTGHRVVRIAVAVWRGDGRPLAGARAVVRVRTGRRLRVRGCGRTNRHGRTSCAVRRRRGARLAVWVYVGRHRPLHVHFWHRS